MVVKHLDILKLIYCVYILFAGLQNALEINYDVRSILGNHCWPFSHQLGFLYASDDNANIL